MRRPILAGNWKMHNTAAEALELVQAMREDLCRIRGVDKVLCPSFTAIPTVAKLVVGTGLRLGAQDMHWKESGACTGEVSPAMVREFCDYVIIGHSERRESFGETDESVNLKTKAAFAHGLVPIICVGETLELREAGKAESWIVGQVEAALRGLAADQVGLMVIAYEPIWAIGTGLAASAEEAGRICGHVVRATIDRLYGQATAEAVRIQYGGSIKPSNAAELMAQPDIDGGLVGGASLSPADFVTIVRLSAEAKATA